MVFLPSSSIPRDSLSWDSRRGWWSPPRARRWCWWRWGRRRQRSSRWTVVSDTASTRLGVKHSSPYTTFLVIEIERKFSSGAHAISLIELTDVGCCSEKQCLKLKSYIMRWIKTCFIGFPDDHLISIVIIISLIHLLTGTKFIIIVVWCSVLLLGVFSTVILSSALRPLIRIRQNFERNWESSHLTIFQTRDALEGRYFYIHAIWKNLWEVPRTK